MTLDEIKADINRRGWTLNYLGADWMPGNPQYVRIETKDDYYATVDPGGQTEFESVMSAYEKALAAEGTALLTWNKAVAAMNAERYIYDIRRFESTEAAQANSFAWPWGYSYSSTHQESSDALDPTVAINELLTKCRARWPAKHGFDDETLDGLLAVCDERGWKWALMKAGENRCDEHAGQVYVQLSGGQFHGWANTPVEALRTYMKLRENGNTTA
jgi:hypothetical protein